MLHDLFLNFIVHFLIKREGSHWSQYIFRLNQLTSANHANPLQTQLPMRVAKAMLMRVLNGPGWANYGGWRNVFCNSIRLLSCGRLFKLYWFNFNITLCSRLLSFSGNAHETHILRDLDERDISVRSSILQAALFLEIWTLYRRNGAWRLTFLL